MIDTTVYGRPESNRRLKAHVSTPTDGGSMECKEVNFVCRLCLKFCFFFFLPKKEKRRRKKMAMPWSKVSRDRRDSVVIVGVRRGVGQNV